MNGEHPKSEVVSSKQCPFGGDHFSSLARSACPVCNPEQKGFVRTDAPFPINTWSPEYLAKEGWTVSKKWAVYEHPNFEHVKVARSADETTVRPINLVARLRRINAINDDPARYDREIDKLTACGMFIASDEYCELLIGHEGRCGLLPGTTRRAVEPTRCLHVTGPGCICVKCGLTVNFGVMPSVKASGKQCDVDGFACDSTQRCEKCPENGSDER